ncbi:MAG TPA: EcsC family protein [Cytophagales bacterium]|nr:EcsC family protein [Cytophagales bacterium]
MEKFEIVSYNEKAQRELDFWKEKMVKKPSFTNKLAKNFQNKINSLIPEKFHEGITAVVKNMSRTVLFGSRFTSGKPLNDLSLEEREVKIRRKIDSYKKVGAASGAWIGAGGILLALADLPVLMSIKMKLLFAIAGAYGYDIRNYQERLFILYIFQLAFSSHEKRAEVYQKILTWEEHRKELPENINDFDWRTFQQEYRDYIDIAKLLQLIPGIGAFVGAYANHQLVDKLGETAMNAYRLRLLNNSIEKLD